MVDYWSIFSTYARIFTSNKETNEGVRIHYYHFESNIANTMVRNMKIQTCGMFCKLKKVVFFGKTYSMIWCENICVHERNKMVRCTRFWKGKNGNL
jgi:hypothetical protein